MPKKHSPSSYSMQKKGILRKGKRYCKRRRDYVSIEGYVDKYLFRLSKEEKGFLNIILNVKEEALVTTEERREKLIDILNDPETGFAIRKLLLTGALYHYGVSLPMDQKELDALTKLAIVYEELHLGAISLVGANNTLFAMDHEGFITGDLELDKRIKVSNFKKYLSHMREWILRKKVEEPILVPFTKIFGKGVVFQFDKNVVKKAKKREELIKEVVEDIEKKGKEMLKKVYNINSLDSFKSLNNDLKNFYEIYTKKIEDFVKETEERVKEKYKILNIDLEEISTEINKLSNEVKELEKRKKAIGLEEVTPESKERLEEVKNKISNINNIIKNMEEGKKRIELFSSSRREINQMLKNITYQVEELLGLKRENLEKFLNERRTWVSPENFFKDIIYLADIKKLEERYVFEEINREEIKRIIAKVKNLKDRISDAHEKLLYAQKHAKELEIELPVLGGDFLSLYKLMKEKAKAEDTKLFKITGLNSYNPVVILTQWGDDVLDSYMRIVRNIKDEPKEIDIFLKDSIKFFPLLQ